ncbi:MAG: hypothetical protein AAFQ08_00140 [Bacteroidota bacterium]
MATMQKISNHFCAQPCWLMLLLSTGKLATSPRGKCTKSHVLVAQVSTTALDLTALEEQLLSTYLNAPSDQERLLKLVEALGHTEVAVRDAASNAIDQILVDLYQQPTHP